MANSGTIQETELVQHLAPNHKSILNDLIRRYTRMRVFEVEDGMPRSASATGLVDYGLPPAEMPALIIAYGTHAFGKPPRPAAPEPRSENARRPIPWPSCWPNARRRGTGARQLVRPTISGKPLVYDLTVEPLRDAAGGIIGITCASLDVTGQQSREGTSAGANWILPSGNEGSNP